MDDLERVGHGTPPALGLRLHDDAGVVGGVRGRRPFARILRRSQRAPPGRPQGGPASGSSEGVRRRVATRRFEGRGITRIVARNCVGPGRQFCFDDPVRMLTLGVRPNRHGRRRATRSVRPGRLLRGEDAPGRHAPASAIDCAGRSYLFPSIRVQCEHRTHHGNDEAGERGSRTPGLHSVTGGGGSLVQTGMLLCRAGTAGLTRPTPPSPGGTLRSRGEISGRARAGRIVVTAMPDRDREAGRTIEASDLRWPKPSSPGSTDFGRNCEGSTARAGGPSASRTRSTT